MRRNVLTQETRYICQQNLTSTRKKTTDKTMGHTHEIYVQRHTCES